MARRFAKYYKYILTFTLFFLRQIVGGIAVKSLILGRGEWGGDRVGRQSAESHGYCFPDYQLRSSQRGLVTMDRQTPCMEAWS